ncbi:ribbon-helix-helix protein, CopG family [Streptomyces sp. NPDC059696]|uniref:ribbon-helix-helix protein, CopG family n=1 Tax=Streptomyces sp. NPDC059696 TaxID=3346911 RepID=UPI0036B59D7F
MLMGTSVLSLRIDHDLLERLRHQAAKRGMSVQDYVVRTLIRDDFDQRFQAAVEETEKFYGAPAPPGAGIRSDPAPASGSRR